MQRGSGSNDAPLLPDDIHQQLSCSLQNEPTPSEDVADSTSILQTLLPQPPDMLITPECMFGTFKELYTTGAYSRTTVYAPAMVHALIPGMTLPENTATGPQQVLRPDVKEFFADILHSIAGLVRAAAASSHPFKTFIQSTSRLLNSTELHSKWGQLMLGRCMWINCVGMDTSVEFRERVLRTALVELLNHAVRGVRDEVLTAHVIGPVVYNPQPVTLREKEKLYFIAGWLIQKLQLEEITSKKSPNWKYITALQSLRVPRGSPDIPLDAASFQKAQSSLNNNAICSDSCTLLHG